ncbi:hypothetical protein H5410_008791 [Solanum commersonii]|uniref:Uncharacterized protein n=1 Tax=Solanum commersonii TaxID=4109 RepID=A0A9J6AFY4_SOLCO|nr:hypothetical protein H5410_008791 [Solanum commersonii]
MESINNNFSGSILAAPDFIYSAKICSSPPRPSSLLLFCSHNLMDLVTVTMLFSDGAVLGILLEMPRVR